MYIMRRILIVAFILLGYEAMAQNTTVWLQRHEGPLVVGMVDVCEGEGASVGYNYTRAFERAGMVPVVIPLMNDSTMLSKAVEMVDIVFLAGGEDMDPAYFHAMPSPKLGKVNHARDTLEMKVLEEAVAQRKPIVGICRGLQVINVYFGGTLYQDLPSEYGNPLLSHKEGKRKNELVHPIKMVPDSYLARALGTDSVGVNSNHHQAIKDVAEGFRVTATSPDGVVEAIEHSEYPCVAFQFHPECLVDNEKWPFLRIFSQMVELR